MTACAHSPDGLVLPRLTNPESATAVDVTTRCKALTDKGPEPKDAPGKNVYLSRREWKALARIRGVELGDVAECIDAVHNDYAKGLPQ